MLLIAIAGLVYAIMLVKQVKEADQGTAQMQEITTAVREGASALQADPIRQATTGHVSCSVSLKTPLGLRVTPGFSNHNDIPFVSEHPGIINFVFCDRHVTQLNIAIDHKVAMALATRAGGEVIGKDY